jgi:hypothetical protein
MCVGKATSFINVIRMKCLGKTLTHTSATRTYKELDILQSCALSNNLKIECNVTLASYKNKEVGGYIDGRAHRHTEN